MNRPLRRLSIVILIMFLTLMAAATYIQFFAAPSLNADPRNARTLYREYGVNRGPIIVAGKEIVKSRPVNDAYRYRRLYLEGPAYCAITGYFSVAHNSMTGLERTENSVLGGSDPRLARQKIQDILTGEDEKGAAVSLTVNPKAQAAAVSALGNRKGAVVALEPGTGKILALVSTPGFDPNAVAAHEIKNAVDSWKNLSADPTKPLVNRALGGNLYPPGSVFKVITAAAMLESGLSPDSQVDSPTVWTPPGTNISVKNDGGICGNGSGKTSLRTAFVQSCNTTFALAGKALGAEKMISRAEKFGFRKKLAVPLPVRPSRFPKPADDIALAMDSFGQRDIQVSPIQMAMVAAGVANHGKVMKPYLVDKVLSSDLEVLDETEPKTFSTPVSPSTADALSSMMQDVVNKGGGKAARVPGINVAGKTGTAETGKNRLPHAWFIGFEAGENSRVAVAVLVENSGYGGEKAAPIAQKVIRAVTEK